jgi:bacteriorhodopsin
MTDPVISSTVGVVSSAAQAAVAVVVTKEETILSKAIAALAKNPLKWTLVAFGVAVVIVVAIVHLI